MLYIYIGKKISVICPGDKTVLSKRRDGKARQIRGDLGKVVPTQSKLHTGIPLAELRLIFVSFFLEAFNNFKNVQVLACAKTCASDIGCFAYQLIMTRSWRLMHDQVQVMAVNAYLRSFHPKPTVCYCTLSGCKLCSLGLIGLATQHLD